ncbi:MAG: MlaE family ABC transporter permease [Gemmatimonadota bacterium]
MRQRSSIVTPARFIDSLLKRAALDAQTYFLLLLKTVKASFTRPFYVRDLVQQMETIGVNSLGIVILTGLFTGMVLALQAALEMEQFGAVIYMGRVVGASAVRELGPVLTALMVTGRAGSGMAAELGAMKVTEQVDALDTMGVDPVRKLVVTRVLAALLVLPLLTVVADVIAVLGGLLIAVVKLNLTFDLYMRGVYISLAETGFLFRYVPIDILTGMIKPIVFGGIMALTACHYGLTTEGGTEGVGRATTRSVVTSSVLILAADYFITQIIISLLIRS